MKSQILLPGLHAMLIKQMHHHQQIGFNQIFMSGIAVVTMLDEAFQQRLQFQIQLRSCRFHTIDILFVCQKGFQILLCQTVLPQKRKIEHNIIILRLLGLGLFDSVDGVRENNDNIPRFQQVVLGPDRYIQSASGYVDQFRFLVPMAGKCSDVLWDPAQIHCKGKFYSAVNFGFVKQSFVHLRPLLPEK